MPENKTFQLALIISILIHFVFFLWLPHGPFVPTKRSLKELKIVYCKIKKPSERVKRRRKKIEPIVQKLPQIKKEEILKPPKSIGKEIEKAKPIVKGVTAIEKIKEKKIEAVIGEEKDDVKRASYINYYRAVREKIRQRADMNYPRNKKLGEGEIFLSFVVASSGKLYQVKVIDEKSTKDPLLRSIAINSIRDAAPFQPFPKGMSQYQITFNVIISFELNR